MPPNQRRSAGALRIAAISAEGSSAVAVIERRDDLQRLGQQHAVAEHVTRHVAATDHLDRLGLHVHAALRKVALH
jgi:hypothetical protein